MRKNYLPLNQNFLQQNVAHRGLHSNAVIENSMQAFALAIEGGFGIEIDVHLLTDGEIAVVHDSNLKNVTGQDVVVEELSSADLEKYPLLLGGGKIPTLRETLAFIDGRAPLLIEMKFGKEFDKKQVDAVLAQLQGYAHKDKIALQSFDPRAVRYCKKKSSAYSVGFLATYHISRGKLLTYLCKSLSWLGWMRADFISYDINFLPNRYVNKKRKKGYQVLAWTVDTQEKLRKAAQVADNIIFENIQP